MMTDIAPAAWLSRLSTFAIFQRSSANANDHRPKQSGVPVHHHRVRLFRCQLKLRKIKD
jgi:hypothetical protein